MIDCQLQNNRIDIQIYQLTANMNENMNRLLCYKRLHYLLQSQHKDQLLQQIKLFDSLHHQHSRIDTQSYRKHDNAEDIYKESINEISRHIFDEKPMLYYTEKAVIAQIGQLIIDINEIETSLNVESKLLLVINRQLQSISSTTENDVKSDGYVESVEIGQTLSSLCQEISGMQERIRMIRLLDDQIDAKLEQIKQKNKQLHQQILNKTKEIQQYKLLLTQKIILQQQIQQLSQKSQQPSNNIQHLITEYPPDDISQIIIEILEQRVGLQQEVVAQQKEKEDLTQMLSQFKQKYNQVLQKNQQLRAKLEQGKRSTIFELMQV